MRKLAVALGAALCLTLVALPATDATAAKPKKRQFVVSATFSAPATPVVGQRVSVKGRVPGAARTRVRVELRLGSGKWQRAATVRTDRRGRYRGAVRLTRTGPTALRVVKTRSRTHRAGVSRAVSIRVWKWIDLTTTPYFAHGGHFVDQDAVIGGARYARAFQGQVDSVVLVNLAGRCSRLELASGIRDADVGLLQPGAEAEVQVFRLDAQAAQLGAPATVRAPHGPARGLGVDVTGAHAAMLIAQLDASLVPGAASVPRAVIANPRALCSVDRLPAVTDRQVQQVA